MKCLTCKGDCILSPEKVLDEIFGKYMACSACPPDPGYNKSGPLTEKLNSTSGKCKKCGRRHLDLVIGNVLTILKEEGIFPEDASLKDVGTPLIAFGFTLPYPPRLDTKSLVLIMDSVTRDIAREILGQVPEVKGVVKRTGSQSQSIGILDTTSIPHTYELLAGCDMRCDIISSSFGELCVYKNQSKIHIEFNNTKIAKMEELFFRGELENSIIVDGLCGPGTLGMLCILAGAQKVIFNDAWLPALENTILNLKANSNLLGIEMDFENKENRKLIADEPVLMATAKGSAHVMVFHGDIRKLDRVVKKSDICLIDAFPAVDPQRFKAACKDFSKKTVII
ncbi:MAG: hypothetical protein OIN87_05845 [Candidatus Methanoperedens sp.]|nr:hypothetical protein [Candidatus Methanoperedens sp.]